MLRGASVGARCLCTVSSNHSRHVHVPALVNYERMGNDFFAVGATKSGLRYHLRREDVAAALVSCQGGRAMCDIATDLPVGGLEHCMLCP